MRKPLPACLYAALKGEVFAEAQYLAIMFDELTTIRVKDPQDSWPATYPLHRRMRAYCRSARAKYPAQHIGKADGWVVSHICLNPRPRQRMV